MTTLHDDEDPNQEQEVTHDTSRTSQAFADGVARGAARKNQRTTATTPQASVDQAIGRNPPPWMRAIGGVEALSPTQLNSAKRSYQRWITRDPERAGFGFAAYVAYAQQRTHERAQQQRQQQRQRQPEALGSTRRATASERTPVARNDDAPQSLLPPHALEAERAVLGTLLLQNEALPRLAGRLKPEHFYSEANTQVFEAITALHREGKPFDTITVREHLVNAKSLQSVGGDEYLLSLTDTIPVAEHIEAHAAIVVERAQARLLLHEMRGVIQAGYDGTDARTLAERARHAVEAVAPQRPADNQRSPQEPPPTREADLEARGTELQQPHEQDGAQGRAPARAHTVRPAAAVLDAHEVPVPRTNVRTSGFERLQEILATVKAARERDTAKYRAEGRPEYPRDSPRRSVLLRANSARERREETPELRGMDTLARKIGGEIVDNPLWIAADYVARTTKVERVDYNVDHDARVREATALYQKFEREVIEAKARQEAYHESPGWQRGAWKLLGNDREGQLHEQRLSASNSLLEAKEALDAIKAGVRSELETEVANRNGQARANIERALGERNHLEHGLRDALLERSLVELAQTSSLEAVHLRHAQQGEALEYAGLVRTGGDFLGHAFLSAETGRLYLADQLELNGAVERLGIGEGAQLSITTDTLGAPSLRREDAALTSAAPHSELVGEVRDLLRDGDHVVAVKLREPETQRDRWVSGHEVLSGLQVLDLGALTVGAMIESCAVHDLNVTAPTHERGRA